MPVSERPLHVFGSYQCAYDADLGVMKLLAVTGWQRSNKTPFEPIDSLFANRFDPV